MGSVRALVESVTESLFPGLRLCKDSAHHGSFRLGEEIMTNLPMQVLLFFNVHYSPLWVISRVLALYLKYRHISPTYQVLCTAILLMMSVVEIPRLYLGYLGNLTEQVPALAGFWLLTVVLQLPLLLWLAGATPLALPLERATDIPFVTFLTAEAVLGFFVVRHVTREQTKRFLKHASSPAEAR